MCVQRRGERAHALAARVGVRLPGEQRDAAVPALDEVVYQGTSGIVVVADDRADVIESQLTVEQHDRNRQ